MNNELWANLYEQKKADINGFSVWLYMISCSIGNLFIVEWEGRGKDIHDKIFREDIAGAEKLFKKKCTNLINGRYD